MNKSLELTLLYKTQIVGRIFDAFEDDATWFGKFEPTLDPAAEEPVQRLLSYITFCEEWNERARSETGADAIEFDHYQDLIKSKLWAIESPDGERHQIENAPIFFQDGEISWHLLRKSALL
jgi:hypothetical protein